MKMIPFSQIRSVVIFRRNGLGDILCSIPLVLRCKELMPQAHISLCIEEKNRDLAPYLQGPDEVVLIAQRKNKYLEMALTIWPLRKRGIDIGISAKTTPMKLINRSLLALGAKYRIAYVEKKRDWCVNCPVPNSLPTTHQALRAIHLIDPQMDQLEPAYYPQLRRVGKVELFSPTTLLVSVSNNRAGSTISPSRYATFLNALAGIPSLGIIVNCLPKDRPQAEELVKRLQIPNHVYPTETLGDFLALLNSVDGVFTGDGGIVHLASALHKPLVALYGGTKPWEWGPLNSQATVLSHEHHVDEIDTGQIVNALHQLTRRPSFCFGNSVVALINK